MRYLISYDLVTPGKNYEPLWAALKALGAVRILDSQWVAVRFNTNCKGVADFLLQYMDSNDRILVSPLTDDYAYRSLKTSVPKAA